MGLELVEIVMEVEETFGVIVSDEAAPELADLQWSLRQRREEQGQAHR
jgi:acyl carrier protein